MNLSLACGFMLRGFMWVGGVWRGKCNEKIFHLRSCLLCFVEVCFPLDEHSITNEKWKLSKARRIYFTSVFILNLDGRKRFLEQEERIKTKNILNTNGKEKDILNETKFNQGKFAPSLCRWRPQDTENICRKFPS